jgi:GNAT superfamily N-acetyltransferase
MLMMQKLMLSTVCSRKCSENKGLKMAEFYITLPTQNIAEQIAALLNLQNKLYKVHNILSIINSPATYFVEVEGEKIVGCSALIKEHPTLSKSYHTSVLPSHQKKGIASKLLKTAMDNCETRYIYGTIRQDNLPSLGLVKKLGWQQIRRDWNKDHWVVTMAKKVKA